MSEFHPLSRAMRERDDYRVEFLSSLRESGTGRCQVHDGACHPLDCSEVARWLAAWLAAEDQASRLLAAQLVADSN